METGKNNTGFDGCFGRTEIKNSGYLVISDNQSDFSYSLIDLKANQCVGLCSFPFRGNGNENTDAKNQIIREHPSVKHNFARLAVLFTGRECTLIPEEVYSKDDLEQYINLLFEDKFSGEYESMHLPSLGNYLVYKIPSAAARFYRENFPGMVFYHSTGFLLNMLSRISIKQKKPLVHAHFLSNHFEMTLFEEGKLLFYNSFEFQTSEEIAYYILFALKQWNIQTQKIIVSGQMNVDSDELYWLKKYISNVAPFPVDELLPYPASVDNPLYFINLLSPELCE